MDSSALGGVAFPAMGNGYGLWFEKGREAEKLLPDLRQAVSDAEQPEIERIMQVICAVLVEGHRAIEDLDELDAYTALRITAQMIKLKTEMTKCLKGNQSDEDDGDDDPDRGGPPFKPAPVGGPSAGSGVLTLDVPAYTYQGDGLPDGPEDRPSDSDGGGVVKTAA